VQQHFCVCDISQLPGKSMKKAALSLSVSRFLLLCHGAGWKIKRKSQQTAAPWQERAFLNQISDDPSLTKIAEHPRYFL
jgi:hypothetical protein